MLGDRTELVVQRIIRERNGDKIENGQLFDLIIATNEDNTDEHAVMCARLTALEERPAQTARKAWGKVWTLVFAGAVSTVTLAAAAVWNLIF